jgi:hypothetical protein
MFTSEGLSDGVFALPPLQLVERARQIVGQPRAVDPEVLQDHGDVVVGRVERLDEQMFDFDIVVRARETEARRAFDGASGWGVHLRDQATQVYSHDFSVSGCRGKAGNIQHKINRTSSASRTGGFVRSRAKPSRGASAHQSRRPNRVARQNQLRFHANWSSA